MNIFNSSNHNVNGNEIFPKGLIGIIIFLSLLLGSFIGHTVYADSTGHWKSMPPTPTARTETAVALLEGKIYLIGGFTPTGISDRVEVWDPKTETWTTRAPLPKPLHHTSATVVNGKLYVIGGFSSGMWTPVNDTFEYDPKSNQWTKMAPMPTARGAMATGAIDGKIYVVGGAHKKLFRFTNSNANDVYDPAKNQWESLAPIPTPRDHLTVSAFRGKLYALGGRINVDYDRNLNHNEVFDPNTNQWTTAPPLPTARSGITSQVLGGMIFVFGGESGEGTFSENEAYDPEQKTWKTMAPMPTARHGLGSARIGSAIHVLTGGPNPGGGGSTVHEMFSLSPFK